MYALTVLMVQSGQHQILSGTLIPFPPELLTGEQVRRYVAAPLGWSICPLGYDTYVTNAPDGSRIVIPGMTIPGETRRRRKIHGYDVKFDRARVEAFAKSIVEERARIEEAAATELQSLTHDIRALSAEIYTAADLVKNDIAERNIAAATYRTDTVLAAQQMLSIRLDIVDFSTGQFLEQPAERIPVYKKVHKVINCLRPKSVASSLPLIFQGPSVGMTYGPPIFELIPFVLVQNALKYAPAGSEVNVKVSDFLEHIDVHVQSKGPRIRGVEVERIFERGYRGIDAQNAGRSGSGLGLFAARTLTVDGFGGRLDVSQDGPAFTIQGADYFKTTFTVRVPRVA